MVAARHCNGKPDGAAAEKLIAGAFVVETQLSLQTSALVPPPRRHAQKNAKALIRAVRYIKYLKKYNHYEHSKN